MCGNAIGRVDVELLDDGEAVVSWLRKNESGEGEICIRFIAESGTLSPIHVVAATGINRSSGFPQMLRDEQSLLFAWTNTEGDQKQIETGRLRLKALAR
ncbi:MAG: hypothetical protein HKM98_04945 [Gammaproteobacteria bacterium]|nr:hypothetical protein [Gammaproteobacteria bacterium]